MQRDRLICRAQALIHCQGLLFGRKEIVFKKPRRFALFISDPFTIQDAEWMLRPESALGWINKS